MICAFAVATFSRFLPCSGCAFDKSNASLLSPKQSKLKQEQQEEQEEQEALPQLAKSQAQLIVAQQIEVLNAAGCCTSCGDVGGAGREAARRDRHLRGCDKEVQL